MRQNSVWREKRPRTEYRSGRDTLHVFFVLFLLNFKHFYTKMATEVVDDHEMRQAQRDYLDFLDDDVSIALISRLFTVL